jgi:uncharacterized membrane protein YdjX (TVP38/TMEM64 family)
MKQLTVVEQTRAPEPERSAGAVRTSWKAPVRGLSLVASLVALGYLLEVTQFGAALDETWIDAEVRGQGIAGTLLFIGAGTLFTAVGLPRQLISFLGGYAFGLAAGTLVGLAASVLGCALAFYYARWLGGSALRARLAARARRLDGVLRAHPLTMSLLIRLLPVGSNVVTNLLAGLSNVRAAPFLVGSALGYVPQTAVFALIGSGIGVDPVTRIGLGVALFAVSGGIGAWLYQRKRRRLEALFETGSRALPVVTEPRQGRA